jgi:glutathione synthase
MPGSPVLFLLNDRWSVKPVNTTYALICACHRLGYPVLVSDVVHLQATSSTSLFAEALEVPLDDSGRPVGPSGKARVRRVDLDELEAIIIRTAPGKDIARSWAHRLALEVMRLAHENGVRIVNNPIGLQRASSKLYTVCLPEAFVPRTMVCHSLKSVQIFAEQIAGPFVMKPLLGSQGRDVFFLDNYNSLNTRQVVDILGRTGYLVVQEYVPEAVDGDIRVLTLDQQIVGGDPFRGIRRTPAVGERRSNVSLGGKASIVELTSRQTEICHSIAGLLTRDGIRFSGLDLVGDKIVEVNVFSPSGLQELDRVAGSPVSDQVMRALLT